MVEPIVRRECNTFDYILNVKQLNCKRAQPDVQRAVFHNRNTLTHKNELYSKTRSEL